MDKESICYNCIHLNLMDGTCNNSCGCAGDNYKERRFRVESRSSKNHFRVDCNEEELEYWKAVCKYDSIENKGKCYYREFPVSKNKKIYYAKDKSKMTKEELELISKKLK